MVRKTRLVALRTTDKLGQLEMMMAAPLALGSLGYFSFW
jgi:hypothetical protein